jgi:exodeoxyribonuclease-3
MQIMSLNLNGIRSASKKGFFTWLDQQNIDVVCVQETRAHLNSIHQHEADLFPKNYFCYYVDAEKKGYSGVGIYCRKQPKAINTNIDKIEFHQEGRYLQIDYEHLSIVSLYLPSGSSGDIRQQIKFDCINHYGDALKKQMHDSRQYIICGDWNIAHKAIDLKNWRGNQKNSGFLPEERAWMDYVIDELHYVDAFRSINQEPEQYTWWSNRGQAWAKNVGWRIDYQIISPDLAPYVKDASIYKVQRFSDHAPLIITYDDAIKALM